MIGSASEAAQDRRAPVNPYVGPRPFELGETLYGREDEINDLYYLWNAERIALLHSPSGAGKSSLLQAGFMPRIAESFDVWGPTRVNLEANGLRGTNRYVLSVLQGFEEGVPERLRRPPEALAGLTLAQYFATRPRRRSAPKIVALLFDQFEEILTVDPLAVEAKREFFHQLGELLHNPRVWALFVLREDFLAPLDPYVSQVPTHFKNRFRIDLLSLDSAREAIVNPARRGGREFPAADRLLRDLATMKVQEPDGSFHEEAGRSVEPVQLQVVCFRLWNEMPEDDRSIDAEDLESFGDVTEALADYYADSVTALAGGDERRERAIRDWFGEALITSGGLRGQVLKGREESEGLANDDIERLLDTHLVRAEKRAGVTWYELAHDRLIEPVRDDNATWRAEHLSEAQQRATLWESQGRPPGLLLRDDELRVAEAWATGSVAITPVELRFLEESRRAQDAADHERRQGRRIKRLALVASVVGFLALVACGFAVVQMFEAERQRKEAVSQREEADRQRVEAARQRVETDRQRVEADRQREEAESQYRRAEAEREKADEARGVATTERDRAQTQRELAERARSEADRARLEADEKRLEAERAEEEAEAQRALAQQQQELAEEAARTTARLRRVAEAEALALRTLAMEEETDRELPALLALAAYRINRQNGGEAENPQIYGAMLRSLNRLATSTGQVLHSHGAAVRSLAVSPRGHTLACGTDDGEIRLIDLSSSEDGKPQTAGTLVGELGAGGARALAFGPEGRQLAAGGLDGAVRLWDVEDRTAKPRSPLVENGPAIHALAFAAGTSRLAAGDTDGAVRLWDLAAEPVEPVVLIPGDVTSSAESGEEVEAGGPHIRALAFAPDGVSLAVASPRRGLLLWENVQSPAGGPRVVGVRPVRSVAISRDGRYLAAGTAGGAIELWDLRRPDEPPVELLGHTAWVEDLEFHPARNVLASASSDASLRLWDADRPQAPPLVLEGHTFWVWAVVFNPGGERLISGSGDRTLRIWPTSSDTLAEEICRAVGRGLTDGEWNEYLQDMGTMEFCRDS